ncbi:DUF6297 family protein [Micromonospora inyonensis]|uniref:ABC-2 type transport system permease protein n=1 Tax=Micromonospora inyonensis TaxID=47866 RepID=A0A1C6S901_9ACTN|nr:DUF6297 family protein [Micromonospora inyonensis]SCL25810.1 hypothetical protein GA0074694_4331 [Micromonospora inyonensis]
MSVTRRAPADSPVSDARPWRATPPGAARRWLRQRRREHEGRAGNIYFLSLSILVGIAVGAGTLPRLLSGVSRAADPATAVPLLAVGLLGYAFALTVAARFGPVTATPATLAWWLTGPVDRRALLLPSAALVLSVAAVAGALHGAFVVAVVGATDQAAAAAVVTAGIAAGLLTGALVMVVQTVTDASATVLERIAVLLGVAAAVLTVVRTPASVVSTWIGPWSWPQAAADGRGGSWLPWAVLAGLVVTAVAVRRLDRLPLRRLAAGSTLGAIAGAGLVTVDPGIASRAAEERRWAVRSPRGGGLPRVAGPRAVVGHDLVVLRRSPQHLLAAGAALLVPALLGILTGWGVTLAVGWLLSGLVAITPSTVNARRDRDLPALRRLLNLPGPTLVGARSALPVTLAVAWCTGAGALLAARTPGADGWVWPLLGAAAGPGLAVGALRAARRGAVRHELPPIVTPMGILPTGPLHWAATGYDVAVLFTAPTLVALVTGAPTAMILPQAIVSAVGVVAFVLLAGRGDERR